MPPSDKSGRRSKPRADAGSGHARRPSSSRSKELSSSKLSSSSSSPRPMTSSRPIDSKPSKPSKHQEIKRGAEEKRQRKKSYTKNGGNARSTNHARSRSLASTKSKPRLRTIDRVSSSITHTSLSRRGPPSRNENKSSPSRDVKSSMTKRSKSLQRHCDRGSSSTMHSSLSRRGPPGPKINKSSPSRNVKSSMTKRSKSQQRHSDRGSSSAMHTSLSRRGPPGRNINMSSSSRDVESASTRRSKSQQRHSGRGSSSTIATPLSRRGPPGSNINKSSSSRDVESTSARRSKSQQRHNCRGRSSFRAVSVDRGDRELGNGSSHRRSIGSHGSSVSNISPPNAVSVTVSPEKQHRSHDTNSLQQEQRRHAPQHVNQGNGGSRYIQKTSPSTPPSTSTLNGSSQRQRHKTTSAAAEVDRLLEQAKLAKRKSDANASRHKQASPSSASSVVTSSSTACSTKSKKKKNKVGKMLSKISQRVRSRSRERRLPKDEIDPWSEDPANGNTNNGKIVTPDSKSTNTHSTKSSKGSHVSSGQGGHTNIICSESASVNAFKTRGSAHPPPPRTPFRRTASTNTSASVGNNGDWSSRQCPLSSATVKSKSREASSASSDHLPLPLKHSKRSSAPDLSVSCGSLLRHKPAPPPPPRRTGSQAKLPDNGQSRTLCNSSRISLNHSNNNIPTSHGTFPAKDVSATPSISNATNQPQLQKHLSRDNKNRPVSNMAFTDPYGDSGLYSGEVDDGSRPHGKGKMKYDNGIFYDGNWIYGRKDESRGNASGDQMTNETRDRILSGFTSWKGQNNNIGEPGSSGKGAFVYGMQWIDFTGMSGKYTGHVNKDDLPDGKGVMRYEFGLVAEGEWIKGKLNDGAGGGMSSGVVAQSVAGGMSVASGGISAAGGAATIVSGLGMMSIGGGGGMMMGGYPNGMVYPQYMNTSMPMAASYYNPTGASMGGAPIAVNYQQQQPEMMMNHPAAMAAGGNDNIPTNIMASEKR